MIKKWAIRGMLLAAFLSAAALIYFYFGGGREHLRLLVPFFQKQGMWGMVLFVLLYVLASLLFLPISFLGFLGGVIFGMRAGFSLVLLASVFSALLSFWLGRYLLRDWVQKKIQDQPAIQAVDHAVGRQGWRIVALSRLTLLFPFTLLNFSYGTTRIGTLEYGFASTAGMAPGIALLTHLGSLAGSFTGLRPAMDMSRLEVLATLFSVLASLGFVIYLAVLGRRLLQKKIQFLPR